MAISSALNPQNIIGNRQGTAEQFQNFITGGNGSLGSSIVNSTSSNKIVPFERGGVRPITPDFNSIISNISTKNDAALTENIKSQDTKVQSIINNIQNVFQTTLQNFTKGYQENLKKIEDSKPSGILEKFFGLYNNVTGFIQFFGDRKNLNKISDSLKGLRGLFEDSFETAKLIRKTINKIVKQLSSLPVATPSGGGGFNLDIRVPGSPLKNAAGKVLGGGRGKMLALGAGALGTGMLAGGAINALTGSEDIQPAAVQQNIPENLADSLSSIVDRFVNAIDSLIKSAGEKPKSTPRTSGGGGGGGGGDTGGGGDGGNGGGAAAENSMELIAGGEGGYNSINMGTAGDTPGGAKSVLGKNLTDMTVGQVMDAQANKGVHAAGKYQIIPSTMKGFVNKMGISREDKFNEATQEKFKEYVSKHKRPIVGSFVEGKVGENKIDDVVMELAREFASVGVPYDTIGNRGQRIEKGQSFYSTEGGNAASINPDKLKQQLLLDRKKFSGQTAQTPPPAQVAAAPTQTQANQAKASAISQPVTPKVTPISIPPQVSSVGGQSQGGGGGGGVSAPPPPSGGSPSVPFLPAGNVDNFLVLYSKMVYNIVDG
jgi:hypothetical protein